MAVSESDLSQLGDYVVSFDLVFKVSYLQGRLEVSCEFDSDLFEPETVDRLLRLFLRLLDGITSGSEERISSLSLLDDDERRRLLVDWNDTSVECPHDVLLHTLFTAQAEQTPDSVAVHCEGLSLSYRELDRRANQLANRLRKSRVGPEVCVGLHIRRSVELVVGLLAISKAGGAYVPLDPDYPAERLSLMVNDAQVRVLLTQLPPASCGSFALNSRVISLESERGSIEAESEHAPPDCGAPDNLAYVIYTSGSTGRPKGAMITHRSLVNYLLWCERAYPVAGGIGSPVQTSIGFDATITSLLTPLLAGRSVTLLPDHEGIEGLVSALNRERGFSLIKLTPSQLDALNELQPEGPTVGSARALVIGGENLTGRSISVWLRQAPETVLLNEYGPTEATVGCCVYEVPRGSALESVPIGKPIMNTALYVVDGNLQPVPVGTIGEILIGGLGLARGYIFHPQLTAERFIPDPFGETPGSRLYRTGDLARHGFDGNLVFAGRADHQVKIRGARIEPGEIEAALTQHEQIRDAVVVSVKPGQGRECLAAYFVLREDVPLGFDELRRFLLRRIPEYMIPSFFVRMRALPLTQNGKIDRRALPPPVAPSSPGAGVRDVRNPVEAALCRIWTDVLGLDKVGIQDNFFELGGDSILGIQVVARANQQGIRISLRQIFDCQTVGELAVVAGESRSIDAEQGPVSGRMPSLSPIQQWFFDVDSRSFNHFNQAFSFEITPHLNPTWLREAVGGLLLHHDALRLRFSRSRAGWRSFIAEPGDAVPFALVDLTGVQSGDMRRSLESVLSEAQRGLNIETGPLLRVVLIKLRGEAHDRLLFVVHHLAVDGVSWPILLEDFSTAYRQLSAGQRIQLPSKTSSFQTWSRSVFDFARSESLLVELDYWIDQPWATAAALPLDVPKEREANTYGSAQTIEISLTRELTRALQQDVPSAYNTQINDILLTAIVQTLNSWIGGDALLLDLEGHGREDLFDNLDVSRTVGWFTTIFPVLLTAVSSDDTPDILKKVKEHLRGIPNRGFCYGLLRYTCPDEAVRRKLRDLPRAEVVFNYLGQMDQMLAGEMLHGFAREGAGPLRSPRRRRGYLLEIDSFISDGRLNLMWTYSRNRHHRSTIERLADDCVRKLGSIVERCTSPPAGGYAPSDFAEAGLTQAELDELVARLRPKRDSDENERH